MHGSNGVLPNEFFSVSGPMTWDSLPRHLSDPVHTAWFSTTIRAAFSPQH